MLITARAGNADGMGVVALAVIVWLSIHARTESVSAYLSAMGKSAVRTAAEGHAVSVSLLRKSAPAAFAFALRSARILSAAMTAAAARAEIARGPFQHASTAPAIVSRNVEAKTAGATDVEGTAANALQSNSPA